ncbi:MAG: PD-(D/E)XK motif protein [Bacteroidales bacterium]|nr:PD-(D/E)XK motif protein [Bacteroidales bacterium]
MLYHLSLDVRVGNGESLNILIEDVSELLSDNTMASNLFKLKLLESGYYDIHKPSTMREVTVFVKKISIEFQVISLE